MAFRYSGVNWEGREWQTVPAITTLGHQIEKIRPGTDPADGTVASKTHDQTNIDSDHHPDENGNVRGIDIGGEPDFMAEVAEAIRLSRDSRVLYVIYNGRLYSSYSRPYREAWEWGDYTGADDHSSHIHLSTLKSEDDNTSEWSIQMNDSRFADDIAERLNEIAIADRTDLTGEGKIFNKAWKIAKEDKIMSDKSIPTDLMSKQEAAAFWARMKAIMQEIASQAGVDFPKVLHLVNVKLNTETDTLDADVEEG